MDMKETIELAASGARLINKLAKEFGSETNIIHEYSPESFTGTELEFSREICEAVMDVHKPTPEKQLILNLPATVEMATPNVYADQIEWFGKNISSRDAVLLSVHTHNDRGTAVAATELALMAGAEQVEGTLFGNGERTGNVCLVTLAMNLHSQGIDSKLDCSNISELTEMAEFCNRLPVHPRHPYAGELVFTAFSGSHQDAINKGMKMLKASNASIWEVPYLPIDPGDVGRTYESIVRINSQSGKGGLAYIMDSEFGLELPRRLQIEFSRLVQDVSDDEGVELVAGRLWSLFKDQYLEQKGRFKFVEYELKTQRGESFLKFAILDHDKVVHIEANGDGPLEAFVSGMAGYVDFKFGFVDYREHAIGSGSNANGAAYVELDFDENAGIFGAGIDRDIMKAAFIAIANAVNRIEKMHSKS